MTARELIALLRRLPATTRALPITIEALGQEFEITDLVVRFTDGRVVIEGRER